MRGRLRQRPLAADVIVEEDMGNGKEPRILFFTVDLAAWAVAAAEAEEL